MNIIIKYDWAEFDDYDFQNTNLTCLQDGKGRIGDVRICDLKKLKSGVRYICVGTRREADVMNPDYSYEVAILAPLDSSRRAGGFARQVNPEDPQKVNSFHAIKAFYNGIEGFALEEEKYTRQPNNKFQAQKILHVVYSLREDEDYGALDELLTTLSW